jgi:membrane fusion protein, multidrug efflux system
MASTTTENTGVAGADSAAPGRRRNVKPYLVVGVIVAVAAGAYAIYTFATRGTESTDDAQVDADIVPVSARVSGMVLHVHVVDNQVVKKGDLLVELDPADLAAREKQVEAELAAARAQSDAADAQVNIVSATSKGGLSSARAQLSGSAMSLASADAQVDSAKAAVERAKAEAARADDDLNRGLSLLKDQAIPKAQVDSAKATADAAHAAVAQADAQLAEAQDMKRTAVTRIAEAQGHVEQSAPVEAQLAAAKANAELAHARVASTEAELEQAKLQLSYTKIESPAGGLLSKLDVHEGQLLQAGQPVVSVVPSVTYVTANFKETQVGEMRPGLRASISVDAYPGRKFEGTIQSTSPGTGARFSLLPADNATGNFVKVVQRLPVKIAWTNLPGAVHPSAGMSADVTVYTR